MLIHVKSYLHKSVVIYNSCTYSLQVAVFFGGKIPEVKTQAEIDERNELMYRLEDFYLEIPQRMPDQQWFSELIDHYTKYNDQEGALDIWKWIGAHDIWVNMDQEVIDKFDLFFEINDPKSLTQLSDHQRELRECLHLEFKNMNDNPERWYKKRHVPIDSPQKPGTELPPGDRIYSGGGY